MNSIFLSSICRQYLVFIGLALPGSWQDCCIAGNSVSIWDFQYLSMSTYPQRDPFCMRNRCIVKGAYTSPTASAKDWQELALKADNPEPAFCVASALGSGSLPSDAPVLGGRLACPLVWASVLPFALVLFKKANFTVHISGTFGSSTEQSNQGSLLGLLGLLQGY